MTRRFAMEFERPVVELEDKLEALKRLVLRESQLQPLCLIVENLHWIDTETQAWLDSLLESLPAARCLLLVNFRPEYTHGWGQKTYYTQLRLDPLRQRMPDRDMAAILLAHPGVVREAVGGTRAVANVGAQERTAAAEL